MNEPMRGLWKIKWSMDGFLYEGVLVMDGYEGAMRIVYFNPQTKQPECIDEYMQLLNSSEGLIIAGSNPLDCDTRRQKITYLPDNLIFKVAPNGERTVLLFDKKGRVSPVDFRYVDTQNSRY